ncbi:MAG: hypothetical protein V2I62_02980 [Bacteroidales bacterium]|jgi:hypothetical protein|nr:hypothetical protein [Bacteroidales bacterium]
MRVFTLKIAMLVMCLVLAISALEAQPPPPPDPGGGDIPIGGTLPIGSGAIILITLGVGYAARKAYQAREKIID